MITDTTVAIALSALLLIDILLGIRMLFRKSDDETIHEFEFEITEELVDQIVNRVKAKIDGDGRNDPGDKV